tara:strand:+ start:23 stop:319 length:297 start_codon:yes stop_codon:yes gene_type:complete
MMIYTVTKERTPYTAMNCTNNFSAILEQQLSFHNVKDVSVTGARKCKTGGYTTSILINSVNGERFEVGLFSDEEKENIKLNKLSFSKYCNKLFAKKEK